MRDSVAVRPGAVAETHFFRHPEQLRAFIETAVPTCLGARGWRAGGRLLSPLRILSAGCASGEEVYTLALLLRDSFPHLFAEDVQILGIDAQSALLQKAQRRCYSEWSFRQTPPDFRQRHFRPNGHDFVIPADKATNVSFEERNLLDEDLWFYRPDSFDIIFCRNVVMYFTPEVAGGVIERLGRALRPGGFLFLGAAETLRGISNSFDLCQTNDAFYYRSRGALPGTFSGGITVGGEARLRALPTDPLPAPLPMLIDPGWVQDITRASERIEALASKTGLMATLYPVAGTPSLRDSPALLGRALALADTGALTEAARLCRDASKLDPASAMPHFHLALLAKTEGNLDLARSEFAQALQLLAGEELSRIIRFGGGFSRETLIRLCRAEVGGKGADWSP
jgi:chemotaxis protein methyltransferase CheR